MNKLIVEICIGTSCHLLGAQDLIETIQELPEAERARVEFQGVTCLKSCGKGPNVRINGVTIPSVTPQQLIDIIRDNLFK
ncbi:MAG: NAD(P)H-dependent oxidoreductase subunit E [Negativicutes bacterium]|nr:NAD(P)H-dependent oxidoreductase subunit E [Negativicutes bacterium]